MASAPQGLPLFYEQLVPLSSQAHPNYRMRRTDSLPFLIDNHAVPLTIEEFPIAQRYYPIVFSVGDTPVPLALMGLNEGINVFIDETGRPRSEVYIPAYARRVPFFLARLRPDQDDLSLCFDPTSPLLGEFEDGEPLFEGAEPSQRTREILGFCEQYELSRQRTDAFVQELQQAKLLIDGELSIQLDGHPQPFVYRGFQMIDENALREIRGDVARKMVRSGALPLVYAHLFSLGLSREIFGRQVQQGKGPIPPAAVAE